MKKLKTIAMIPARYEASRFPGKLIKTLGDKPVIVQTYLATLATELFDKVYVVTDSDLIEHEIKKIDGNVIRSQKEHNSGSDRIAEAVKDLDIDIVVNVQGDEPFTQKEDLENLLDVFYTKDADHIDLASLMTPIDNRFEIENPNNVKVIVDENDYAIYFSRSPIPYSRDNLTETTYYKHKGIYAFRKQAVLAFNSLPMQPLETSEKIEAIRYIEYGKKIKMVYSKHPAIGIDTQEDLDQARELIKRT